MHRQINRGLQNYHKLIIIEPSNTACTRQVGFAPPKRSDSGPEHFPSNQFRLVPPTYQYPAEAGGASLVAASRTQAVRRLPVPTAQSPATNIHILII